MRGLIVYLGGLAVFVVLFLVYGALSPELGPPRLVLTRTVFGALPGWKDDDPRLALAAFARSCVRMAPLADDKPMGGSPEYGTVGDWRTACAALALAGAGLDSADNARDFLESEFAPFRVGNGRRHKGLFTGYYEAEAEGSLTRNGPYQTPLLKRPADLVTVDLGEFRNDLKGQRVAGKVASGKLVPYLTRAQIDEGALDPGALALVWLSSPIDAFYIHIQGSGRVLLDKGGYMRVGFDGQNGFPFTPIGRVLKTMGALRKDNISMRTIRGWLKDHPEQAKTVMEKDASYIFFKQLPVDDVSLGPLGAEETSLTPDRSLAVDRKYHALGVPMWLDTSLPSDDPATKAAPFQHLMVAQDTGGAILGPVRADVFFGFGEQAAFIAGRMKQTGHLYVLLPRTLAGRLGG